MILYQKAFTNYDFSIGQWDKWKRCLLKASSSSSSRINLLQIVEFGRNSAKWSRHFTYSEKHYNSIRFCFADLLVHDIKEVKRLQAGFVSLFRPPGSSNEKGNVVGLSACATKPAKNAQVLHQFHDTDALKGLISGWAYTKYLPWNRILCFWKNLRYSFRSSTTFADAV